MSRRTFHSTLCLLVLLLAASRAAAAPATFAADVAPLLFQHCAPCHHPGGPSATALLTFQQARTHATQIVQLTASRRMPPWQPDGPHSLFEGDRRLTAEQIAVFRRWLDDGLLEGDAGRLPPVPQFPDGWQLGTPDLVLTMPVFTLRADGADMFRNFVLPVPTSVMRYVRAWEFRPGNARVVHHATMQVDTTGSSARYDQSDSAAGYEGLIAPAARAPDGFFLDWAPGHRPNTAVPGTAWPLPPSSDLVMMLHLRPSGRVEQVQASVALYFATAPPAHVPVMVRLTRQDLRIVAGATDGVATDEYVLPVDVDLYTVQPHAHYLAKRMHASVRRDGRGESDLLAIPDWDFNWQDVYHYAAPMRVPAGSSLRMRIEYDNSPANPRNPHTPPVDVGYGQQTTDEMAEMWFQVVPVRADERSTLVESLYRKVLPEEIKGRESMLRREPGNVALRDDLALMRAETGDLRGAEQAFRETLALRPESASARFNVGMAVLGQGRRDEARQLFVDALATDPNHGPSHFQLGLLQQAGGDLEGAARHLEVALSARPADAEVLLAAGVLDALRGHAAQAITRIRGALEVKPGWSHAQAALAGVLSTAGGLPDERRAEAVRLASAAVSGMGRTVPPAFLDILAGAYAAVGDLARAVESGKAAASAADALHDAAASSAFRARVAEWETRLR